MYQLGSINCSAARTIQNEHRLRSQADGNRQQRQDSSGYRTYHTGIMVNLARVTIAVSV